MAPRALRPQDGSSPTPAAPLLYAAAPSVQALSSSRGPPSVPRASSGRGAEASQAGAVRQRQDEPSAPEVFLRASLASSRCVRSSSPEAAARPGAPLRPLPRSREGPPLPRPASTTSGHRLPSSPVRGCSSTRTARASPQPRLCRRLHRRPRSCESSHLAREPSSALPRPVAVPSAAVPCCCRFCLYCCLCCNF